MVFVSVVELGITFCDTAHTARTLTVLYSLKQLERYLSVQTRYSNLMLQMSVNQYEFTEAPSLARSPASTQLERGSHGVNTGNPVS